MARSEQLEGVHVNYDHLDFVRVGPRGDRRPRLGKGAFGEVYEATYNGRKVAVKEFDYEFLKVPQHQQVFFDEVLILCRLHHENIVEILGASTKFVEDPQESAPPFIVFEFLPTTLFAALFIANPSPLRDHENSFRVATEIAMALYYLHSAKPHRIVHHDLKPENVMLTDRLKVKLIDFGLSSTAATMAATSQARLAHGRGTIGYMPPEKLTGEEYLSARTSHKVDVYSYGVVLWEVFSKQLPYSTTDKARIIAFILNQEPFPICDTVTPLLLELVNACRARDPTQRPSMQEVLERLQQAKAEAAKPLPWYVDYERIEFVPGPRGRRRLGRGLSGEVYEATLNDQKVVVKEFDFEFLKVPAHQKQFNTEVRALFALKHDNLVKIIGAATAFVEDPELRAPPFIVFEFLPTTLYKALYVTKPCPLQDHNIALRIASEISSALDYLHSQKPHIVHHDLKPENVMLTDTLHAKLIDFGLASTAATVNATRGAGLPRGRFGTNGYMPPEKLLDDWGSLAGPSMNSPKVDVFAYGVLLWQIMSKQLPYPGLEGRAINTFIKTGDPLPESDGVTPALLEVVNACRAADPKQRPDMATVSECLKALPDGPASIRHLLEAALQLKAAAGPTGDGLRYRALFGFKANDGTQVSFNANDVIINAIQHDETWMTGTVERTGQTGRLPRSFVESSLSSTSAKSLTRAASVPVPTAVKAPGADA